MSFGKRVAHCLAACTAGLFGVIVFYAAPAEAAAELSVTAHFQCMSVGAGAGYWMVLSNVQAAGTLTAIAVNPASIVDSMTPVGSSMKWAGSSGDRISVDFSTGPSVPSSATLTATVHWDDVNGAPLDRTMTSTISISGCQMHPRATFTSRCATGELTVTLANGTSAADAAGQPVFTITGDAGYVRSGISVDAGVPSSWDVPAAYAGHVVVTSGGATIAEGGYQAAPGCYGYVAPATTAGSGHGATSRSGSGTGGSPQGGVTTTNGAAAPVAADSASPRALTDPSPSDADPGQPAASPRGTLALTNGGANMGSGSGPVVYLAAAVAVLGVCAGYGGVWWTRRNRIRTTPTTDGPGDGEPTTHSSTVEG